ncbi:MAG: glycosyltransferase family 2 protein [Desulfobacteraceae bacterium]|nr:glycosyltransferase family 2 protein [Desulfobacteraceae bacterium]
MKTVAIIVNYRSASLTRQAVQSVLDAVSLGPVQVVVMDNSEDDEEAERLRLYLPPTVALRVSPKNIGFGRACNLAFENFEGDQVLLINPDARLLPGCLLRLQKTLSSTEKTGAVSPQAFWDDDLKYYLPPSIPFFLFELQAFFDACGPQAPISRLLSNSWRYHSIRVWSAKRPVRVRNLSGGLVLLKREAILRAGGLFDARFFLYFEDTDLFIRLKKAGYSLVIEPRAKAVHYYDQCGRNEWGKKREFMSRSHSLLLGKYSNSVKSRLRKAVAHLARPATRGRAQIFQHRITSPFVIKVPARLQKGWLFEASPNPTFTPSAGRFGEGESVDFPEKYWSMLAPGQYFGRLGSAAGYSSRSEVISWVIREAISNEN